LLTPGYAGLRVACSEIDAAAPRRALILGNAIWLAKQMNLIEFTAAADELFYERQIELWVVGNVPTACWPVSHTRRQNGDSAGSRSFSRVKNLVGCISGSCPAPRHRDPASPRSSRLLSSTSKP
jgi:hypothetical protein